MFEEWKAIAPFTKKPPPIPKVSGLDLRAASSPGFRSGPKSFESDHPFVKWFTGGKINASYNCIDRHLDTPRKNKVAILWEGEPGDQRMITYQELHRLVCRFANVLKARGLKTGDRAIIYMPMIPELADCAAGMRAAGRDPQRRIRRIFGGSAQGAHSGSGSAGW